MSLEENTPAPGPVSAWRSLPVSEGGAAGEQDGFGLGLRLVEQAEEGVVFHTDLPEDLTLVSAAHQELQRVLVRTLDREEHTSDLDLLETLTSSSTQT